MLIGIPHNSTCILKAEAGKLDIKTCRPSILFISLIVVMSENVRCSPLSFGQYIYKIWPKLYRQIVGIPMGTYCAPLVTDLFLLCYETNSVRK